MQGMGEDSVDLICTDPPYFAVKTDEWWDTQWEKPSEFIKWIDQLAEQWQRILKPNGSLYCFASHRMSAHVEVKLSERFNILNRITWDKPPFSTKAEMFVKEDLRSFFPASESIIFAEQYGSDNYANSDAGYASECGKLRQKVFGRVFGEYLLQEIERAGVSRRAIAELFPSRSGNVTGCVSNWILGLNAPTKEQYEKIRTFLNGGKDGDLLSQDYEFLKEGYDYLREEYESLRRPFEVSDDVPYTDVWTFATVQVYPGKHPCEKPLDLMEHIIRSSSRPGAVVLDCFAGSGSTLVAAKRLERHFVGIEIDPHWCNVARTRLGQFDRIEVGAERIAPRRKAIASPTTGPAQLDIFGAAS